MDSIPWRTHPFLLRLVTGPQSRGQVLPAAPPGLALFSAARVQCLQRSPRASLRALCPTALRHTLKSALVTRQESPYPFQQTTQPSRQGFPRDTLPTAFQSGSGRFGRPCPDGRSVSTCFPGFRPGVPLLFRPASCSPLREEYTPQKHTSRYSIPAQNVLPYSPTANHLTAGPAHRPHQTKQLPASHVCFSSQSGSLITTIFFKQPTSYTSSPI